jgi:hypothetical protein
VGETKFDDENVNFFFYISSVVVQVLYVIVHIEFIFYIWAVLNFLGFFLVLVGAFIYARKLVAIVPPEFEKKIKSVSFIFGKKKLIFYPGIVQDSQSDFNCSFFIFFSGNCPLHSDRIFFRILPNHFSFDLF